VSARPVTTYILILRRPEAVSKDEARDSVASWFETAFGLLTMRFQR